MSEPQSNSDEPTMQVAHLDISQNTSAQAQEPQSISQPPNITEPERKALPAVQPTLICTSILSINVSGSFNMLRVPEVKEKVKSKQVLRENYLRLCQVLMPSAFSRKKKR